MTILIKLKVLQNSKKGVGPTVSRFLYFFMNFDQQLLSLLNYENDVFVDKFMPVNTQTNELFNPTCDDFLLKEFPPVSLEKLPEKQINDDIIEKRKKNTLASAKFRAKKVNFY
jgi:hypothetical protein